MPVNVNGRQLGVEQNGVFTAANTAPIPGGRLWPEAAKTWNAMRAAFVAEGGDPEHFRPGGSASSARTMEQQHQFWGSQPPPAARPGTSNHGWGIAVDCPFPEVQAWLVGNGGRYGWSNDEGQRVGEQWHFRYVGASQDLLASLDRDPLAGYTPAEKRWITEYDTLTRTGGNPKRVEVLRRVMTDQRKRIWRLAQPAEKGGDGQGWTTMRKRRYGALLGRTK